jgi:glycosyltransferase involved in cell wall biosynthesis
MRVCIFGRLVTDHVSGGLQSDLDSRARWLVRAHHEVTVLTTAHPVIAGVRMRDGMDVHFVPGTNPEKQDQGWRRKSVERFLDLHRIDPFDLVITAGGGGWQYARLREKHPGLPPLVMLMQSPLLWNLAATMRRPSPLNLARSARSLYYLTCWNRRYGKNVEAVLVLSESSRRAALAEGSFRPESIHVIPNGADTKNFSPGDPPETLRRAWNMRPDDPVAIWVSRFRPEKGWREALAAAALLRAQFPRFRLILVVSGLRSGRDRLVRAIERLGLSSTVLIIEDVPHANLPDYFRAAKLLLAPLHGPEGQPLVLIEAMACGLPVVGSAIESVSEIVVDGESGSLVRNFTEPRELARAAAALLGNEDARARAGRNARQRVLAEYDDRVSSERTVALLERIGGGARMNDPLPAAVAAAAPVA